MLNGKTIVMNALTDYFRINEYNMVWKKKSKLPRSKRWKRKPKRSTVNVNRALQPFAQRFICKMKYAADVTTAANGQYIFNLNSIFDPDAQAGGHQPYGFDNLATIYRRYRVIACGWRITTTTTGNPIQLGTLPNNNGLVPVNFAEIKENPRSRYAVQLQGAGASMVKGKMYLPSLMGRTKAQYMADDRYQAEVTANPQELGQLTIYTANQVGVFTSCIVNVMLEYTVEFFDVNNVIQS